MPYAMTTPPVALPVNAEEVALNLRLDEYDLAEINNLIKRAVSHIEGLTGRLLMPQEWSWHLDGFRPMLRPDYAPLADVLAINYRDSDGNWQVLPPSEYGIDTISAPARLAPASGKSWPATMTGLNVVRIDCEFGYADANAVPGAIKQAVLLLCGHWYENREDAQLGAALVSIPHGVAALISPYRVPVL